MARNGSGDYSLPEAAFIFETVISETAVNSNFSDIATALTGSVAADGQTAMTGDLPMGGNKVTGLGAPSASTDAATKSSSEAYTDAAVNAVSAGLFWKAPVVNATTANITLSGEQTIDGVLTSAGRILVKDQTAQEENGVYITGAGAWTRATPLNTWDEFIGAAVKVSEGTANADTNWQCTVDAGGTLETTAITWQEWGGLTTAGAGLTETNGTVSIDTAGVTPAMLSASAKTQVIAIACGDETTDAAVLAAATTFRMPFAFTLTDVRASLTTAATGADFQVDINESATTILSTKLTIDATEKTSTTAATPVVISDASLADDAEITIDVDVIGSSVTGAGLKVYLIGYAT